MSRKVGEILKEKGFCTGKEIERALSIQRKYESKIGTILINMGTITEEQLLEALSEQLSLNLMKNPESLDFLDIGIPINILLQNKIFPFKEDKKNIYILTNDPLKLEIFNFIETAKNKELKVFLTPEEKLKIFLSILEGKFLLSDDGLEEISLLDDEIEKLKELASEAPVIKMVNNLLSKAIESDASDIHFESFKYGMRVRFRIDGILQTVDSIPKNLKIPVITRLKLISGMNIAERRLPQDGRISLRIAGKEVDIRASSVPTQFGESFVLRLLKKENINYSLESLGFYPDQIRIIRKIISKSHGIFLTTGPTGSGKTTTLYSILSELNNEKVKIITVEDPVEYEFKNINQINVKPEINYTFANALRSILRQDPDIIMIGEIRDKETAKIAVQSALTGHFVLSTLHTNNALASIPRLLDMGVESFLIKASVVGLMAQRLVRTVCPYCSQETTFSKEDKKLYKIDYLIEKFPFVKVSPKTYKGCKHCNYTGYKGRTVIAEVIPFSPEIMEILKKKENYTFTEELKFRSIFEDGLLKVIEGKTTFEEILKVVSNVNL